MKQILAILIFVTLFAFACTSMAKVSYEFPNAMAEPVRIEFAKACDKGKILYELNCAGCHNYKKGGKTRIPNFSPEALKGYEIRVSNAQHEENMPDEKVTAEELSLISTFLMYKKKS
jgi:hypothetical protein